MFVFHGLEAQRGINCGGGGTPLLLIFAMLGRRALGGALPVSILNLLEYGSADNSNGWAHDFIGTILTMPLFIGSSRNCCHTSCCSSKIHVRLHKCQDRKLVFRYLHSRNVYTDGVPAYLPAGPRCVGYQFSLLVQTPKRGSRSSPDGKRSWHIMMTDLRQIQW
jgi:hypothetical protein